MSPSTALESSLHRAHLLLDHVGGAGAHIELDHHAHAPGTLRNDLDAVVDHAHHVVPLALDVREHRVGLRRQPAGAYDAHGVGHQLAHRFADSDRGDGKGCEHLVLLAPTATTLAPTTLGRGTSDTRWTACT